MEPPGLQRVRRSRSRRRGQPVGSVRGVVRRGRQGGGGEGPAPSAAVPAPGPVGDQRNPLAPADTRRHGLHGPVRVQRVQDYLRVASRGNVCADLKII